MPRAFVRDEPLTGYALRDHSISIPRPTEAEQLGRQSACSSCHAEQGTQWLTQALTRFGHDKALEPRAWVLAVQRAKRGEAGPARALLSAAQEPTQARSLAALLRLVATQRPDATLAAVAAHSADGSAVQRQASEDPHPFVRMLGFELGLRAGRLSDDEKRQYLDDALDTAIHAPVVELLKLARVYEADKQPLQALQLLEQAARMASGDERRAVEQRAAALANRWSLER